MFSSIKTSEANRETISTLTYRLQLGSENVIARIAFSYSLAQGSKLDLKNIRDSRGKEYSKKVLLGDNLPFYIASICQFYGIYKTSKEIPRYIKMHIDDGIELLWEEIGDNPNQLGFDFLLQIINRGIPN